MSVILSVIAAPEQLLIAVVLTALLVLFLSAVARVNRREDQMRQGDAGRMAAAEEKRQRKALKRRIDAARKVR